VRDNDDMAIPDFDVPFEPCVIVFDTPKRTEMLLRDCNIIWRIYAGSGNVELGYDAESGDFVAVRIYGDVSKR
jgi:hypothetical protein